MTLGHTIPIAREHGVDHVSLMTYTIRFLDGTERIFPSQTDLQGADLRGAHLVRANLSGAFLLGTSLCGANLLGANLDRAILAKADLSNANLTGATLFGAQLDGANLSETVLPPYRICPEAGKFVAWKKLWGGRIAKLLVPAKHATSSLVGRKCRAKYVKVLEIVTSNGQVSEGVSMFDRQTVYRVGHIVRANAYDPDIRLECTHGIHFFMTRAEAVEFGF